MMSSSSSSSPSMLVMLIVAISVAIIAIVAPAAAAIPSKAASLSVEVLRMEDLPDLDAEQSRDLGFDLLNLDAHHVAPQSLVRVAPARPSSSVVASEADAEEFARWMLDSAESTLNLFGAGSDPIDDESSTGSSPVASSSGVASVSSSASSPVASSTGAARSSSSSPVASSSAGVSVTACSNLVLSSNNVAAFVSYGSVSITVSSVACTSGVTYSVTPALPAGLSINTATGAITGSASVVSASRTYTVTASNAAIGGGAATATFALVVTVRAPTSFTFSVSSATAVQGSSLTPVVATVAGSPCTFTVSPALPVGVSLNAATGVISGIPTVAQVAVTYTVTATNSAGVLTAAVTIRVTGAAVQPPFGLAYPVATATYYIGDKISANIPVVFGAGTFVYTISPALPAGLTFSSTNGIIKGTPSAATTATTYTVTVTTAFGVVTTTVVFSVVARAPTIAYLQNPASLVVNSAIDSTPIVSGTRPYTFAITPALPAGLSFSTATGAITGRPTLESAAATYNVTVSNSGGSTRVGVVILVAMTATPPSALVLSASRVDFPTTVAAAITATVAGTTPMTFSVSPALVAGLTLNTATGAITGTALATTAGDVVYTVTARNSAGSAQSTLTVSVTVVPVTRLNYASRFGRFKVGVPVVDVPESSPVVGTSAAGDLTFTASALPAGITLNATTGELSGTPTMTSEPTTYTITASNSQGSVPQIIQVRVVAADAAPPVSTATVQLNLAETLESFTPAKQATFKTSFGKTLGVDEQYLTLLTAIEGDTPSAASFVAQAGSLAVRVLIDLSSQGPEGGDITAVTAFLDEQLEAGEFELAGFPGAGVVTNPPPLPSTGPNTVVSSSSGSATGSQATVRSDSSVSNGFKWTSLGGALLIVFIIVISCVAVLGVVKYMRSREVGHEKLYSNGDVHGDQGAHYGTTPVASPQNIEMGGAVRPSGMVASDSQGFHYSDAA